MKQFIFLFFLPLVFLSCEGINRTDNSKLEGKEQAYELVNVDSVFFRRAYHGHDTMNGEELDVFLNRNPDWCSGDEDLKNRYSYKGLVKEGIILDGNLNLSEIDTLPETFEYHYSRKQKFTVQTRRLEDPKTVKTPSYELTFLDKQKVVLVDTLGFGFPPDVTFFTRDLNADGKDELCALFRWYIINGDNFDITIYELK